MHFRCFIVGPGLRLKLKNKLLMVDKSEIVSAAGGQVNNISKEHFLNHLFANNTKLICMFVNHSSSPIIVCSFEYLVCLFITFSVLPGKKLTWFCNMCGNSYLYSFIFWYCLLVESVCWKQCEKCDHNLHSVSSLSMHAKHWVQHFSAGFVSSNSSIYLALHWKCEVFVMSAPDVSKQQWTFCGRYNYSNGKGGVCVLGGGGIKFPFHYKPVYL